jgi:hypothetical protein
VFGGTIRAGARQVDRLFRPTSSARRAVAEPFFPSHRHLLRPLDRQRWPGGVNSRPGAVVVPTARPATAPRSGLRFAARLALESGCPLVVLASQEAATAAAVDVLGDQVRVPTHEGVVQPDTLVLRIARGGTRLTSFEVDELPVSKMYRRGGDPFGQGRLRRNDVGRKRNLALLLAAGQQWGSVLLVDDDIFDVEDGAGRRHEPHEITLDTPALQAAAQALEESGQLAVGWAARGFDDNSVLCRMAAQTGASQDQFIGAGALLVPISAHTPFFPSIYNQDWLFLLGLFRRRVAGTAEILDGGDVHQDEYSAYCASRAAAEELGDVLGEGMLSLLHEDAEEQVSSPAFWRRALEERRALKDRLREQVLASGHDEHEDMLKVLNAVDRIHERLMAKEAYWIRQLMSYAGTWRRDLVSWGRRLHPDDLPPPARLLRSKEFDAARVFGAAEDPDHFLRLFGGEAATDARRAVAIRG